MLYVTESQQKAIFGLRALASSIIGEGADIHIFGFGTINFF